MLNATLLREDIRNSRKSWITCTAVLAAGLLLCAALYGSTAGEDLAAFLTVIPGMTGRLSSETDTSLVWYLGKCLYGAVFLLIPCIYAAGVSVRTLAGPREDGSFAMLFSMTGKRRDILFTHAYFLAVSLFAMILAACAVGLLAGVLLHGSALEIPQYLLLNLDLYCCQMFLSGLCFALAGIIRGARRAKGILAAWIAAFYLIFALGDINGGLSVLGSFSVFSAFRPEAVLEGSPSLFWELPLLLILGLLLYRVGMAVMEKTDLTGE